MNKKELPKKKTRIELDAKKKLAYTLYVTNGYDQKVISNITGISQVSISNWKTADLKNGKDWEADRAEKRSGFDNERRRIKAQMNRILDQVDARDFPDNVVNTKEGDVLSKLSASAKNLITELTFDHKSKSYEMLVEYVQTTYGQDKAVEIVELCHEYLMSSI